ncbi:hypothetical protein conserved [Leishmania donovani]|nr:hypothetical protein conserved [Leishmania donovani]
MLRRTFFRSSRLGPMWPPGVEGPGKLSSSVLHTMGCAKCDGCAVRRVDVLFSSPPIAASSISAAAVAADSVSRAWRRSCGTVSLARTCAVACQRRAISFSYGDRVPCIRFNMSTERLARATAQPTLPTNANIFMMDVRKGQRKSKRVNPKSTMASIITAHRAEAQKAKEELDKDDAYTPPLIFLFRTDDTKKQAARRQEQIDAQLDALGAFGEFRACVLDGIKSRHWTRYIDSPTTPDRPAPDKAESASSRDAPPTASVAAAAAAAVDPAVVSANGAGDAPASPLPISGDFAGREGKSSTGAAEAPAAAVSPRVSAAGAAEGATGAAKEADDLEGEDEEVWEEVEVELDEGEEVVEGGDGGGDGTNSAADGNGAGASQCWEAATYVDRAATPSMRAKEARTTTPADEKIITAPSTAKRSVNTVWAHVKSQTCSGGSAASAAALVAAAAVSSSKHDNPVEEESVDVADLDGDGVAADAASPAAPGPADHTDSADGVNIPDTPRRSGPERNNSGSVFLATAHAPPLAEADAKAAALTRSTDAEALLPLEEFEEFDIDGPLSESVTAEAPAAAAVPALNDATPEALSAATAKGAESWATEHAAAGSVSGDDGISAAEEAAGEESASAHTGAPAALGTAAKSLTEVLQEDAAAGAAGDGPALTASEGDSADTEVEGKDAEEDAVAATAAENNSDAVAFTVAAAATPVSPPKPSISMPVYTQVVSRLYYGATTVYLSDRAFIELPATANVLVIDHLDWDDAHLAAIDAALEQVDPVAGHVLLYPDAYAPQSEHVIGNINAYRRSLLPFIFVFRTQLSNEAAMAVQHRLANALHVRPTLDSTAQQSLVAGQNDRTSVCVLSAAESEKGGENPMLAPQPRKATPASPKPSPAEPAPARTATATKVAGAPRRAVTAPVGESGTAATASAPPLPRTPPAATEGKHRDASTRGVADDAVQHLWDLLNSVSFDASSKKSAASAAALSAQVEVQRSHHGGCNGNGRAAAEWQQRISAPGASSVRGNADQAEPVYRCPAETTTNILTRTSDTRETGNGHITASTAVDDAAPSQPSRLAYAPSLLNSEVTAPFLNASARADAAGGAGAAHRTLPATTLQAESAEVNESAAMIKGGLFNFGAIAFGRDNGYCAAEVPRLRRASGSRWGMNDDDDDVDSEHNATDAADGAATSSTFGSVSDLGLYPVSESVAAARAEAARISSQCGGGSPFTDEEIAKIEEEIILAQLREKERKERRSEARRAMRAKAKEAKSQFSCKTASSSSPVSSAPSATKGSRLWKQQFQGSRSVSDSFKTTATAREQELAEDGLLEDFISSLLVNRNRSKKLKADKVRVSVASASSRGVVRSARRTLATATSSTGRGIKQ